MVKLCMLLLLSVASILFSQLPGSIDAVPAPAPDFDFKSSTKSFTEDVSSGFNKGVTAVNGFTSNLWNKTKETFSSKDKLLEKPKQWWKNVKSFFTPATTAMPPRFWETTYSKDFYGERDKREAEPYKSVKAPSDPEAPRI
ncbi:Protein of unknown function [Gryllus bimaculatus]|nr:Protein of unknown function [Gryllus bimaculatus]